MALCCDATLVSPISTADTPHAADTPRIALRTAKACKRATYPELRRGGLCVLAAEVGGRWNQDARHLVRQLLRVTALRSPPAAGRASWASAAKLLVFSSRPGEHHEHQLLGCWCSAAGRASTMSCEVVGIQQPAGHDEHQLGVIRKPLSFFNGEYFMLAF